MARFGMNTLMLASLLLGGEAAVRPVALRREVGECAVVSDKMTFTQGKIMGTLPSAIDDKYDKAETGVVAANLIAIEYASNYKVVTEKMSKELYVLTQCGTTPPTTAELADVIKRHPTHTVKHFTIPIQVAASSSTVHLAFFKALGVQDRIKYVDGYASGPCWQKALGCGGKLHTATATAEDKTKATAQMAEVDAFFTDCNFDGTCGNVNKLAKGIHVSASQDPSPLHSAEHIKFIAAFFNKEEVATQLFAKTVAAYTSAASSLASSSSPKPTVAWISHTAGSKWAKESFDLSQATYKLKMVVDAGGVNVDGAAVKARMLPGTAMSVTKAATGNTYKVMLSSFNEDKAKASAAFFAALGSVDIIIDETYEFAPKTYTMASFLAKMGLASGSEFKAVKNKMVLRIDGTISEKDGLDWYESRIAHPDWAVGGLARQMLNDPSKQYMYFRNIAKGEAPRVLLKSMCKASLPACNATAYPSPIGMMVGAVSTSSAKTVATGFGVFLMLMITGA